MCLCWWFRSYRTLATAAVFLHSVNGQTCFERDREVRPCAASCWQPALERRASRGRLQVTLLTALLLASKVEDCNVKVEGLCRALLKCRTQPLPRAEQKVR
jgi:hypothetical protein